MSAVALRTYLRGSTVFHLPVNLRSDAPTGIAWCGLQGPRERVEFNWAQHVGICRRCQAKAPPWWVQERERVL